MRVWCLVFVYQTRWNKRIGEDRKTTDQSEGRVITVLMPSGADVLQITQPDSFLQLLPLCCVDAACHVDSWKIQWSYRNTSTDTWFSHYLFLIEWPKRKINLKLAKKVHKICWSKKEQIKNLKAIILGWQESWL